MNVKMKVNMSGTRNGQDWPAKGECVDLPGDEAVAMVQAGLAEVCEDHKPVAEKATAPAAPKTAAAKPNK